MDAAGSNTNLDCSDASGSPAFFCHETGVYSSTHSTRPLPQDPLQDVVSFIFSHPHNGVTALVDAASGTSVSYAELRRLVASLACGLRGVGVKSGDAVLVMLPNSVMFPVVFLGVLAAGAVVTTMNPLSSMQEIKKQVATIPGLSLIFTSAENVAKLEGPGGVKVAAVPETPRFGADEIVLFRDLLSHGPGDAPRLVVRQSDTAAVLFSSGTTGHSKGIVLTHENLIAAVELFVRFEASQNQRPAWHSVYLAALPMFHVYGLALFTMGLLSVGSSVVVMKRFQMEAAARAIECYKVTHFPTVPPLLAALTRFKNAAKGHCFDSLLQVSCGAAPVNKKMLEDFVKAFPAVDFIQGYGLTETTAVGTRGFNTLHSKRHTSVGLLAPNMQAKVFDQETGAFLPPGRSGELWLRGPAIMQGYLNDQKATSLTITEDGWFRTGDVVYFDQDGFLYILDRIKDTIKYKGFQIAPADLEDILSTHPEVLDTAVTSAKDEEAGEIPVAFVIRKQGSELSSDDLIQYVAKQVASYKKIRKVVFVDSIPRSAAGKILRRQLRGHQQLISKI